ncbi:dermonecrotic toxin domain-containing protein [Pseudomonas sp. UV AK001]|uniref:dermonecrotic toxin domain-containing protein n=1 Tax=Pseudomonas sp. UV AK001 TaxID=3384791 RepID=UPI0038D3D8C0
MSSIPTAGMKPAASQSIHGPFLEQAIPDWLTDATSQRRAELKNAGATLPRGYRQATRAQRRALHDGFTASFVAQSRLDRQLSSLQDIDTFAEPLLIEALQDEYGIEMDVKTIYLRLNKAVEAGVFSIEVRVYEVFTLSLLQAALHNFEDSECEPGAFHRSSGFLVELWKPGELLPLTTPMTVTRFTALCRSLDIGAKYQAYLKDFFDSKDAQATTALRETFIGAAKADLRAAAQYALSCRDIEPEDYTMILTVIDGDLDPRLGRKNVWFHDLSLMKHRMTGCVCFSISEDERYTDDLLLYIPHDPYHPLKRYTRRQMEAMFKRRFTEREGLSPEDPTPTTYQRFFSRFVAYADRGDYFSRFLQEASSSDHFSVDVITFLNPFGSLWHVQNWPPSGEAPPSEDDPFLAPTVIPREGDNPTSENVDLWNYLFERHRERIIADARSHAVPTADVDEKVRSRKLAALLNIGMLVLTTAAGFVPVLGEIMMAVMVGQLLEESIEGVIEWSEGDRRAAKAHLIDVAENLALFGLLAGAGKAFSRVRPATAAPVIEKLRPVTLADGDTRLWNPDLTAYESPVEQLPQGGPNAQGQFVAQEKTWIRMQGRAYEKNWDRASLRWRIRHPRDPDAYQPILSHNGAGAWRSTLERPLTWDRLTLLRRIGHSAEMLTDEQLLAIADIGGVSDDSLRRMHMDNLPPPPELADALQLFDVQRQTATRDARLLKLQRVCPGLGDNAAREVLAHADAESLAALQTSKTVPRRLLEEARWYAGQGRAARAYAGLYQEHPSLESGRLALRLLEKLPGWPGDVRLELRDSHIHGPLLEAIGSQSVTNRVYMVKQGPLFQAFSDHGWTLNGRLDTFFPSLMRALPRETLQALGLSGAESGARLQRTIIDYATAHPEQVRTTEAPSSQSKRAYKPPIRLQNRRFGYLASGEGALGRPGINTSLVVQVLDLYPNLDFRQANGVVLRAMREGQSDAQIMQWLNERAQEWERLESTLDHWAAPGPGLEERLIAARNLKRCWRQAPLAAGNRGYDQLDWVCDDPLPSLSAGFPHVKSLLLQSRRSGIGQIRSFLRAFPEVRYLDLSDCALTTNPVPTDIRARLVELDLSGNPLYRLDVSSMPNLKVLNLEGTLLQQWPRGAEHLQALRWLDLRNTRITTLAPEALVRDDLLINMLLAGTPLEPETQIRLQEAQSRVESRLGLPEGALARFAAEPLPNMSVQPMEPGSRVASRLLPLPPAPAAEESLSSFINRLQRVIPGLVEEDAIDVIEYLRFGATDAQVNARINDWSQRFEALTRELNGWIFVRRSVDLRFRQPRISSKGRADAAHRIMECWQLGLLGEVGGTDHVLDLEGIFGVGALPDLPEAFPHVAGLNLRGLELSEQGLRGFLTSFKQVETLDLAANALENLPEAIGGMERLEQLDLSANRLHDEYAAERLLGSLNHLKRLRLNHNHFRAFSAASLEEVELLELNHNRIRYFNEAIPPWLEVLHLSGNDLREWPAQVLRAERLRTLRLLGNPIRDIPAQLFDGNHDELLADTRLSGNYRSLSTASLQRIRDYIDRTGGESALGITRERLEQWIADAGWEEPDGSSSSEESDQD